MQTHEKIQFNIVIEQPAVSRLRDILDSFKGVHGYTVMPIQGGRGASGLWTRDGQVSEADGMVMVMCIVDPMAREQVLSKVYEFVEPRIGFVSVHTVEVVRSERF